MRGLIRVRRFAGRWTARSRTTSATRHRLTEGPDRPELAFGVADVLAMAVSVAEGRKRWAG